MIRKVMSAFLFATSLTSFLVAGLAQNAIADNPPKPPGEPFCDFYTVPNDPKTYCGGICPLETYVCYPVTELGSNPPPPTCNCHPPFETPPGGG